MIRYLTAALVAAVVWLTPAAAQADSSPIPVESKCNTGWYVNPDEGAFLPEQTEAGLKFEGKDLVHHATAPLDFTDFDKTTKGFVATTPGKVVFKAETSGPYGNIVINADGKLWSTAFKPEAVGGQNQPVDKAADLIGKPDSMKPGKDPYTSASRVVTFGVGYWVEDGDTVVSSITFHGHTYSLTCKPKPSPSTSSPTATPTTTRPTTSPATTAPPTSGTPVPPAQGDDGGTSAGDGLPVTGPGVAWLIGGAAFLVAGGGVLFLAARHRRTRFQA